MKRSKQNLTSAWIETIDVTYILILARIIRKFYFKNLASELELNG